LKLLDKFELDARLFTYKVAHDGGSAPNPYHNICTLAICKPAIRRVAVRGDVIAGLACKPDDTRLVYCMVVERVLPWSDYIRACAGKGEGLYGMHARDLRKKVPASALDPGDCIWPDAGKYVEALASWSKHGGSEDFDRDVRNGENVLLSTKFWYFGQGVEHAIHLENELLDLIPGRGHRSNANKKFREAFVDFFNSQLRSHKISGYGRFGTPAQGPGAVDEAQRSRCRAQEVESDSYGEEDGADQAGCRHC
jgi:hypothetical protein